ncbi:MAG: hypothetical protein MJ071_05445 [Oscillospiraceae bacterium]|nr:hypothetical protein [Oscillospiraceae bacterium]
MKKLAIISECLALLALTACGASPAVTENGEKDGSESVSESSAAKESDAASGLVMQTPEGFDEEISECLKTYFTAIEQHRYAGYEETVYPPYVEVYAEYLKEREMTLETAFDSLCSRFDEDGYDSWHLTELVAEETELTEDELNNFFDAYVSGGVFDEAFVEQCKEDADEIKDIKFTLYALYEGDEEAIPIVTGSEILMLKTEAGTYLFG